MGNRSVYLPDELERQWDAIDSADKPNLSALVRGAVQSFLAERNVPVDQLLATWLDEDIAGIGADGRRELLEDRDPR